jgi:hypothetical protein
MSSKTHYWRKGKREGKTLSRYWMTLQEERILEIERGSTTSHSLENSLWKRL